MKTYSTKILFLLSLTLLINQADAVKQRSTSKEKPHISLQSHQPTQDENKILKALVREKIRNEYQEAIDLFISKNDVEILFDIRKKLKIIIKRSEPKVRKIFEAEFSKLIKAFLSLDIDASKLQKILGLEIANKLNEITSNPEVQIQIISAMERKMQKNPTSQIILKFLTKELPVLAEQLHQKFNESYLNDKLEKILEKVIEKAQEVLPKTIDMNEDEENLALLEIFGQMQNALINLLHCPNQEEADSCLNQLCNSLDSVKI